MSCPATHGTTGMLAQRRLWELVMGLPGTEHSQRGSSCLWENLSKTKTAWQPLKVTWGDTSGGLLGSDACRGTSCFCAEYVKEVGGTPCT